MDNETYTMLVVTLAALALVIGGIIVTKPKKSKHENHTVD
jgi:general stress protein CsbA